MKQFSCGDVVPGCKAVFRCNSEQEILGAVAEHARRDHGLMDISEQLVAQVRAMIRTVNPAAAAVA